MLVTRGRLDRQIAVGRQGRAGALRPGHGPRSKALSSGLANTYEVRALTDLRGPPAAYPYVFELDGRGVLTLVSETITLMSETVADGGRSWCLQG